MIPSEGECSAPLLSPGQGSAAGDRTAPSPEAVSAQHRLATGESDAADVASPKALPMATIWYEPPRHSVAEVRALGSPLVARSEHRAHIQDLACWLGEIQHRTGRVPGTDKPLLASEQREYDRRVKAVRELEQLRPPKLSAADVLRRLESENY